MDHSIEESERKHNTFVALKSCKLEEDFNQFINNEEKGGESKHLPDNNPMSFFNGINDLTMSLDDSTISKIYICAYKINREGKYPFLQYLLEKQYGFFTGDILTFPAIQLFDNEKSPELLCKEHLFGLIKHEGEDKVQLKGFYKDEETSNVFAFFDITEIYMTMQLTLNDQAWLVLIDEIVHCRKACNTNINDTVSLFFLRNVQFCYMNDVNDRLFDIPICAFTYQPTKKMNFTCIFGEPKSESDAIMGPYYYFTNYDKAILKDVDKSHKVTGSIIRFALFTENMKVITDLKEDNTWSKINDSVYIGKIALLDGTEFSQGPLWIIKDFSQQIPLSCHLIDKKYNSAVWSSNEKTYIRSIL
jgi:hypothetical protein